MYELDTPIEHPEIQIITEDDINPRLVSPSNEFDLTFYQTRETLSDPERYKNFLKNAERRFRASREYKLYKSYLMDNGLDHCMVMGNIESDEKVDIELHHNVLNLFDICILISEHMINTIGHISTFDLIQLLIIEHFNNNIGVTFLSSTAHELYTNNPNAYIPPNMTFGTWWLLLEKYKYGITYDIAQKVNKYIAKYRNEMPLSINIVQQEQILDFSRYNKFSIEQNKILSLGTNQLEGDNYGI